LVAQPRRRKKVVDAALDSAADLVKAQIEFLRSVVRSAGQTLRKE
jgi:sialic acid synthase SpsE